MTQNSPKTSLLLALFPILFLIAALYLNVQVFGDNSLSGPNQFALLCAAFVAALIGVKQGFTADQLTEGTVKSISSALPAILILLMIGALAGTWLISGVVPTMVYYGLKIMHPSYFLVAAVIVSAIVSIATGSSWSTIATVGLALLGIGKAMGIHEGMVAGAIISGAYFGDKMSPLSDTTNLAPAMAGTDLFTHIRYMSITTIPSLVLTLVIFAAIGFTLEGANNSAGINELLLAIEQKFFISPVLFVVPVLVILLIVKKVPALPALFIGALAGAFVACVAQPQLIKELSGENNNYLFASFKASIQAISGKTAIASENAYIAELLKTKGMEGMMGTIWLIICAMAFGGIMETTGLLQRITTSLIRFAKSDASLVATTTGTCVFFNATASDQYLAIVVPGRMFQKTYEERGLAPENLSRTLEDSGTVTSVLFPWNTCGAAQASVLNVATGTYWMYCFFNIISPLMTIIFAAAKIKIARLKK